MFNKSEFRFSETFNNANGKTSGSAFMGIILGLTGALCFMAAMVGWFMEKSDVLEVMGKIVLVITVSAGLLGLRKVMGAKEEPLIEPTSVTKTNDKALDKNKQEEKG
jgi:hypothetical protein